MSFPWEYLIARVTDLLDAESIIGIGDRGTKVSDVQSRLTELGYGDLVGAIDGSAGANFDAAVRAYEIDRGFSATGLWVPPSEVYRPTSTPRLSSDRRSVAIVDSVGTDGVNHAEDVRAVGDRLDQLGFMRPDRSFEHCIRLFQTVHDGGESVQQAIGRIDPSSSSLAWLNAVNAPRWQRMPAGSEAEGFRSRERLERSNDRGWGTDWLAEALERAGAHYVAEYLDRNPDGPLIWCSSASPLAGGELVDGSSHPAGLQLDIVLPPQGASSRGLRVDSAGYDRDVARAVIKAFWSQGEIDVIYLNDNELIAEGICQRAPGHDDRIQVRIRPPQRIDVQHSSGRCVGDGQRRSSATAAPGGLGMMAAGVVGQSYGLTKASSLATSLVNLSPSSPL